MEWLDNHDIPFWDLCFMKHKGQVGADIYIEDSPEHVENLRKGGFHVICFGNPTNKGISAPRAETWEQVYELVPRPGRLIDVVDLIILGEGANLAETGP
jgi:hypothetical protein